MTRTVRSSFYCPPGHPDHNPRRKEFFTYDHKPVEYRGFEIFCVIPTRRIGSAPGVGRVYGGQYDIVQNDVCIGQVVTLDYAKKRIDEILAAEAAP